MLKGKHIILGVTGSIAAYKAASLASLLSKEGAHVETILTKNAEEFIAPLTFETLTKQRCYDSTFDRSNPYEVTHIAMAQRADIFVIAPATANIIAKLANGIADDMLSTTALAVNCKKLIAPAMNTKMWENPATQENIEKLKRYGWQVLEPIEGLLACKDVGKGKMPEPETIFDYIKQEIDKEKDMEGLKVLVTAGPTMEKADPVRVFTNRSTGKMGYALAKECSLRGADVTLITGKSDLTPWPFLKAVKIESAEEMYEAVMALSDTSDIIIKAAAVADYRPKEVAEEKMKKGDGEFKIEFERTKDILKALGEKKKDGQFICGFSMETENMLDNSYKKLVKKNADMIVANNLKTRGAGFGTDTNVVTLIMKKGYMELPLMTKDKVAENIVNEILNEMAERE